MSQVSLSDVPQVVLDRLQQRAQRHGRTLEAELKCILESAVRSDMVEARRVADQIRQQLHGLPQTDSAVLLAEDRNR